MKKIAELLISLALLAAVIAAISTQADRFPLQDYVEYWSAGYLNVHQENPYDPANILRVEQSVGFEKVEPVMMYNPPWLLTFAMPMALLPYDLSRAAFFVMSLLIVTLSASLGWKLYRGDRRHWWAAWLVSLIFYAPLHLFECGQITVLVVLGISLFFYFLDDGRDFLAGFFAPLLLIKPHVVYLLIAAILLWTIKYRRWKVLLGLISGFGLLTLIPLLVNPAVFAQYLAFPQNSKVQIWATATLAGPVRYLFDGGYFLLQFVPAILGLAWFAWFWYRHQNNWDWKSSAPLVILVSMVTSAYGWVYDQAILYLVLIQAAVILSKSWPWKPAQWAVLIGYWALNIYVILVVRPQHELWWVSSVLLILYLSLLKITPQIQRSAAA